MNRFTKKIIAALFAISCIVSMVLFSVSAKDAPAYHQYSLSWMEEIPDDTLISNINIPGTHDSASKYIFPSKWMSCQDEMINDQLDMGVRYMDIRLKQRERQGETELILMHAMFQCRNSYWFFGNTLTFSTVMEWCESFLKSHPSETLVMTVKIESGDLEGFDTVLYDNYILPEQDLWFLENRIPTLGEVRGKLVLVRRFELEQENLLQYGGLDFTGWEDQGQKDQYHVEKISTSNAYIQDRYQLKKEEKWEKAVKPYLEETQTIPEDAVFIHFLSTAAGIGGPKSNAKYINRAFSESDGLLQLKGRYGWVVFDVITPELCQSIYQTNFES